jgi:hypothetical protein
LLAAACQQVPCPAPASDTYRARETADVRVTTRMCILQVFAGAC